jgi:hypothetical protein
MLSQQQGAPAQPQAVSGFGALGYAAATGNFSWSWGWDTEEGAKQRAAEGVLDEGGDVVTWAYQSYIALARTAEGTVGWACNAKRKRAIRDALAWCQQHSPNPTIALVFHTRDGRDTSGANWPASSWPAAKA